MIALGRRMASRPDNAMTLGSYGAVGNSAKTVPRIVAMTRPSRRGPLSRSRTARLAIPVSSAVTTLRCKGIRLSGSAVARALPGLWMTPAAGPAVVPCCPAAMTVTVPRCGCRAQACALGLPRLGRPGGLSSEVLQCKFGMLHDKWCDRAQLRHCGRLIPGPCQMIR